MSKETSSNRMSAIVAIAVICMIVIFVSLAALLVVETKGNPAQVVKEQPKKEMVEDKKNEVQTLATTQPTISSQVPSVSGVTKIPDVPCDPDLKIGDRVSPIMDRTSIGQIYKFGGHGQDNGRCIFKVGFVTKDNLDGEEHDFYDFELERK